MVQVERSFERKQLNLVAGMGAGGAVAAGLGALAGAGLQGMSTLQGALLGCLIGVGVGALVAKAIGGRVVSEVPEPLASDRSFVGCHAPDDVPGAS